MLGVRYTGTAFDPSGYGQANRNFITALHFAGVDVSAEVIAQTPEKANYGWQEKLIDLLKDRTIDYKVKFIHLTPDLIPDYMEDGKYHISHLFWETDRLPKQWVAPLNKCDEVWTGSEDQANMMKKSGVKTPIKWFPQPIDTARSGGTMQPYIMPDFDGFIFYAVFQWIERKNPKKLLQTYWKTFSGRDDVALVIKSYRVTYSADEFIRIKNEIQGWMTELNLKHYPRTYITKKLFSTDEIFRIHLTGDCFINASRGEGWNIPSVEAMLMGRPIISINKTGVADHLPHDLYYPCGTKEVQATESPSIPWYTQDQNWLDINERELGNQMMSVYEDQLEAKHRGKKAQQYVKEQFNYHAVGMAMRKRLEEIYRNL